MAAPAISTATASSWATTRCSWPSQALAYRLGYEKIWELRRRAERDLGEAFDVREFHAALLESGSLPLEVLEEHIDWWIEGRSRSR